MSYAIESVNWGDIVAMIKRIPVFQQGAVCLTKFGPESGETAKEILARKDLERRSGIRTHKNEFWWGIGEKGTAQFRKQFNFTVQCHHRFIFRDQKSRTTKKRPVI